MVSSLDHGRVMDFEIKNLGYENDTQINVYSL